MKQITIELCNRCHLNSDDDFLREIAYSEDRYLPDLLKKAQEDTDSALHQEAEKQMDERLAGELEDIGEEGEEDEDGRYRSEEPGEQGDARGAPRPGKEEITREDLSEAIEEYKRKGLLDMEDGRVIVTPKAVNKLAAGALERILKDLRKKNSGSHHLEIVDFGMEFSPHTRPYEVGDDYATVDIERTALNALRRCGELSFEPEDFEIHEEIPQSKLSAAIIIDESGSMRDTGKLEAAQETALALSRLILREPDNILRIYVFSDEVKQIEPWEIVNEVISGGDTDIRSALSMFRRAARHEYTDKQVYLITDSEPNNEDGRHVGVDGAMAGLLEEASRYRQEKIGLNIIMLDEVPELKSLASTIAKKNLGRVFFTSPDRLGEVLVEDYLKGRKEGLSH